jgi:membrane fusion protein (multidrug efflux system)
VSRVYIHHYIAVGAVLVFFLPAQATPPPAVTVTAVVQENIAPSFSNIGHVIAIQSVKITPRVTAFIDQVNFKQGSYVKSGDVLFTLQPEQYQAALQMAQAQLASAKAALTDADLTYHRAAQLNATGFSPQAAVDAALATHNEDEANVLAAQASLANAALNLSYCIIKAPIDGRIGAVALTKGNLVDSSTGPLATINQIDPIRVEFSIASDSPILSAELAGGSIFQYAITLDLPDGTPYPIRGKIAFVDNHVDTNTGTVNVYADFANPAGQLLPGAYVNVETAPVQPKEALLVPVEAVQTYQDGSYVLVVNIHNKVVQTRVTLGDQIAQNFVVLSGLKIGDMVVVDGIQKVKNGDIVSATNAPSAP